MGEMMRFRWWGEAPYPWQHDDRRAFRVRLVDLVLFLVVLAAVVVLATLALRSEDRVTQVEECVDRGGAWVEAGCTTR
jgi:hypothetical protein